jgi:conjugal transfer pilus assembly protein TrbC
MKMRQIAFRGLLALCSGIGIWSGAVSPVYGQAALPSDADMRAAQERMAAALNGVGIPLTHGIPVIPEQKSLPRPAVKNPDIAKIAEAYRQPVPSNLAATIADVPELMVFVSFSLPRETLQRIVSQSEKSGAVLVLRGLKGNSLTRMGEEIAELVGDRNVTVIIHPPAFKQFNVEQVPSLVLAKSGQASKITEDGCAPATSFIKIDGDVTQDYALDLIERHASVWAKVAHRYSAKLAGHEP